MHVPFGGGPCPESSISSISDSDGYPLLVDLVALDSVENTEDNNLCHVNLKTPPFYVQYAQCFVYVMLHVGPLLSLVFWSSSQHFITEIEQTEPLKHQ